MQATQKTSATGSLKVTPGDQRNGAVPAPRRSPPRDAVALLKADHKEVKGLFRDYQDLVSAEAGGEERQRLAERICALLTIHATIEEELFYPSARDSLGEDADLVDEADVEHSCAKDLIAQIRDALPEDPHYDAKVKVLGEYIDHHVKEEEGEMFPLLKDTDLDLKAMGEALAARKAALVEEMGLSAQAQAPIAKPPAARKRAVR